MADPFSAFGKLVEEYGAAFTRGSQRWRDSVRKIQDGTYTADDLVQDSLYPWIEGAGLWWNLVYPRSEGLPTLLVRVTEGASTAAGEMAVDNAPPQGNPECTDLAKVGAEGALGAANHVTVTLENDRGKLVVRLRNLGDQGLRAGEIYHGVATVGDTVLALVCAVVVAPAG